MAVFRYDEIPPQQVRADLVRRIAHLENLMTTILDFSGGPWPEREVLHSHPHEQVSYVVSGEILFFCEGEKVERLQAGDVYCAPSNKKHGIQLISDKARIIDNFSPIREDFLK